MLALIYAQNRFGLPIPYSVKIKLDGWIDFIQGEDGGSGYGGPDDWKNVLKTGNLLFEMALVGDDIESPRVQAAIHYIEEHWNDKNQDPGWLVNYQAMYTLMKGFESMGINTITVNGEEIDWFEDISFIIVESQRNDGSWPSDMWGDPTLTTAWALLTLEKVTECPTFPVYVDVKPGSWPNPINTKSKGVISIAICGTQDFDIMEIDPATIQLHVGGKMETVSPLRWSYEDVATPYTGDEGGGHDQDVDGFTDLVLKFDKQEMINSLDLSDYAGETIPLVLDGNFFIETGGAPIKGKDYVWILDVNKQWTLDPFIIDDTGNGDYTWEEARKQPWCKGKGTLKHPYIIENVIIDGAGSLYCIRIYNSDAHFIVGNCKLYGIDVIEPSGALVLLNTENGVIIDNYCSYNGDPMEPVSAGIALLDSDNNIIKENNCTGNWQSGIYIASSNYNEILDNYCGGNDYGIVIIGQSLYSIGDTSEENLVENNYCSNNDLYGILLTAEADNNYILWNEITENDVGIMFSGGSDDNEILHNTIKYNRGGIYFHWELGLDYSINNEIDFNDFLYNSWPYSGVQNTEWLKSNEFGPYNFIVWP